MLFGISPLQCLYASVPAGRHKGKQTDRQAGELAGGQECLPVRKSENGQAGNYVFFTCVAAFGAVVAACGVFEPYFRLGKHPTFAPKRQGKAESAHRRPRLRPSFGQQKGIGRPMPYKWVMAGLSPIRLPRIFVSSIKGFRVTPETTLPLTGRASSPKSGSLFPPAVRLPKLRLCRDTTKSIVI